MVTKTLTITEQAYGLLAENKLEEESFSEVIIRVMMPRKRKTLMNYFGILNKEAGQHLLDDLQLIREMNLKALREKFA